MDETTRGNPSEAQAQLARQAQRIALRLALRLAQRNALRCIAPRVR